MANAPDPGGPIATGIATGNSYPQWGIKVASDGSSYQVKEAHNESEKIALMKQGYLAWFSSASAAGKFGKSQKGILGGHVPNPLSWVASITGISGHNLLIRGLKIIIGGVLLTAGIMKMTGASVPLPPLANVAKKLVT
jgi:hypothetical protein